MYVTAPIYYLNEIIHESFLANTTSVRCKVISNTNKIDRIISIMENSLDSNENTYITVSNMEESMRAGRLHSLALVYVSADEILLQPQSILANTAAYVTTASAIF